MPLHSEPVENAEQTNSRRLAFQGWLAFFGLAWFLAGIIDSWWWLVPAAIGTAVRFKVLRTYDEKR